MHPSNFDRARGFHGAWVSNARLWSVTTKRRINSTDSGEARLAVVALYLCLNNAWLLVDGKRGIPRDDEARAGCPSELDELKCQRDRLQGLRDELLHLSDMTGGGVIDRHVMDAPCASRWAFAARHMVIVVDEP